jgi:hypothetical protein
MFEISFVEQASGGKRYGRQTPDLHGANPADIGRR